MDPEPSETKEIDFSHYYDAPGQTTPPGQSSTSRTSTQEESDVLPKKFRVWQIVLLILAIAAAGTLWYMLTRVTTMAVIKAPEGYRIIESSTAPPRLEKIVN